MRGRKTTKLLSPIDELTSDCEQLVDKHQRTISVQLNPTKYSALYLGTANSTDHHKGIESIQEPLSKQFPIDGSQSLRGIEVSIIIDDQSLQIQFVSDPTIVLYYPIRSLVYCASIRFATETRSKRKFTNGYRFIPLDKPDASLAMNTQHPPLFSVVFQRTRHSPMNECHSFIVKTKQIAFALVRACADAYNQTDEEQECSKVPLYFQINEQGTELNEINDQIIAVPANKYEHIDDCQHFFYRTSRVQLGKWQLAENPKNILRRSMSVQSVNKNRQQQRRQSIPELHNVTFTQYEESYFPLPQYFTSPTYPSFELPYSPSPSTYWFYV